jgi:hypothetical protein
MQNISLLSMIAVAVEAGTAVSVVKAVPPSVLLLLQLRQYGPIPPKLLVLLLLVVACSPSTQPLVSCSNKKIL